MLFGLTRGFGLFINLLILALYIISMDNISKAGKPGWSYNTIYNIIVYLEIIKNRGGGYFYFNTSSKFSILCNSKSSTSYILCKDAGFSWFNIFAIYFLSYFSI